MGLTRRAQVFVEEYLQTWNASEAARRAGYSPKTAYSQGYDLLRKPEIAEVIRRRVADMTVGTNEGLALLTAHARGSLAPFCKVAERWTEAPRGTDEIVEETLGQDEKGEPVRLYRVRCVVIDVEKLMDPRLAPLVRKLKDSPKTGLEIELHDAQSAIVKLLEAQGLFRAGATNLNLGPADLAGLSNEQLERILAGEDPMKVMVDGQRERNGGATG